MKYEFEVAIVMRGVTLVATADSCYGQSPGFLFAWLLFCFVFSLHKLLPSHFGVRRAGCLHGGEKNNLKKIIKLIASAWSL